VCPRLRNLPKLERTGFERRFAAIERAMRTTSPENQRWTAVSLAIDISWAQKMTATALHSIEADLDRLERQRVGYALALASAHDERTRVRHERTLCRLDEEIGALQSAADALSDPAQADVPPSVHGASHGVPVVDRTAEFTAEAYDEVARMPQRRWLVPAALGGALALGLGTWWMLRPPPAPPASAPQIAPAAVIITSPVPPDSHR